MGDIAPEDALLVGIDPEETLDLGHLIEEGENAPELLGLAKYSDGLDHSTPWNGRFAPAALKAGYSFVVRYVGTPGRNKSLRKDEADAYRAARLGLAGVYEDKVGTALLGYDRGVRDSHSYFEDAHNLGAPDNCMGYAAVDTDTTGAKVAKYFEGWHRDFAPERIGAYGGYWIIKYLFDHKLITWGWQTRAWSRVNGVFVWDPRACLRQFPMAKPFYVSLAGINSDIDWAMDDDYGQWTIAPPPPPPPPGPPVQTRRVLRISDASRKNPKKYPYMSDKDPGAHGEIRVVQNMLAIPLAHRDGIYGPETELAVRRFQEANPGLVVDGIMGTNSWRVLLAR